MAMDDIEVQEPSDNAATTAAGRYDMLSTERLPYLNRARDIAKLTIPALYPPLGHTGSTPLYQPFQSLSAEGVNNLAAKLVLALFPPGQPFFRLDVDDKVLAQAAGVDTTAPDKINQALSQTEQRVRRKMEARGTRTVLFDAFVHLIVGGNGLIQILKTGRPKFYSLDRFVVKRDLDDNVLEIIVKEALAKASMDAKTQAFVASIPQDEINNYSNEKSFDLYTWIKHTDKGGWQVHQELCGRVIPWTRGTYPADKSAWLPIRWRQVPGESYGRGHGEEHLGDITSYEQFSQYLLDFAAACSKILFLVNPSGNTDKKHVADAPSGSVVEGDNKDVGVLQVEKFADFQVVKAQSDEVKQRLERAYLMANAVQRDAERVTAEEIRAMIGELESGLGGIYALLSEEVQRPLVLRVIQQMIAAKELPALPMGVIEPQIVTGVEGLGRQTDLQRLDAFMQGVAEFFGAPAVAQAIDVGAYMARRATALGLENTDGLIRSAEQMQAMQAAQQQHELATKAAPSLVNAAAKGAEINAKGGQDQQQQPQDTQEQ